MAKRKVRVKKSEEKPALPSLASLYAHLKIPEEFLGAGEMAGSFDHVGLPELLQILEANKKTGFLLVAIGKKRGHIIFSRGQILNGLYDKLEGTEAIYALIKEKEGKFRFLPLEGPKEDKIKKRASELILESLNRGEQAPGG